MVWKTQSADWYSLASVCWTATTAKKKKNDDETLLLPSDKCDSIRASVCRWGSKEAWQIVRQSVVNKKNMKKIFFYLHHSVSERHVHQWGMDGAWDEASEGRTLLQLWRKTFSLLLLESRGFCSVLAQPWEDALSRKTKSTRITAGAPDHADQWTTVSLLSVEG